MRNLFTTYFEHPKPQRQCEIRHCLEMNIPLFDNIYLLAEAEVPYDRPIVRRVDQRPTFKQLFDWVNEVTGPEDINVIANSDIYFDVEGLDALAPYLGQHKAVALTRWDIKANGSAKFCGDATSQDVWIFKGRIKPINCEFGMGCGGCDNRLAYEIPKAGYVLRNPSKKIKAYHYHLSRVREWKYAAVPGPYCGVEIE